MIRNRVFRAFVAATALMVALVGSGCHSNTPSGVYTDSTGRITIEFKDGKAYLNLGSMADTDGTAYDVSGEKITIRYPPDGMMAPYSSLTINSDGSLQGGMGTFKKK
jgi:hypothetical protein